jgi:GSH-dependent disulfide-bond oxidoreductase
VFDSSAMLLYLGYKIGRFVGSAADRGDLLSWLMFVATGIGPFSGQAVHFFQRAAPEQISYAINRHRREADRHYRVLDSHLNGRDYIVGADYSIVDMAAWSWVDRAPIVLAGEADPLVAYLVPETLVHRDQRPASRRAHTCRRQRHPLQGGDGRGGKARAIPV